MLNLCIGAMPSSLPQIVSGAPTSLLLSFPILLAGCQDGYKVLREVTAGPVETNACLLYDIGSADQPRSGGFEAIRASVRRLYEVLLEGTVVYAGHGGFTDIDTEKRENAKVLMDSGEGAERLRWAHCR